MADFDALEFAQRCAEDFKIEAFEDYPEIRDAVDALIEVLDENPNLWVSAEQMFKRFSKPVEEGGFGYNRTVSSFRRMLQKHDPEAYTRLWTNRARRSRGR